MGFITKIGACALRHCRGGLAEAKYGAKYAAREAKEVLVAHTKIGRQLREGIHNAREAVMVHIPKVASTGEAEKYAKNVNAYGNEVFEKLQKDPEFCELWDRYCDKTGIKGKAKEGVFRRMFPGKSMSKSDEEFFQEFIESGGVGPTKYAQIISSDAEKMQKIEAENPALAKAVRNVRSNCSFSRTVKEAQEYVDKAFPDKHFIIIKECHAGSIGAAYFVRRPDGTVGMLKMLKKGVDKEQLELEEKLMRRFIREFAPSEEAATKDNLMMKNLYHDWGEELDFTNEYNYNKLLAKGAKRYKVADITDMAKDKTCIIMNCANGVQMDHLVALLKDYKLNPTEYAVKYAKEIKANPWLSNPEKVIKELPTTLLRTFDEQFMFMKKGGKSLMHGDPHTGNFFITVDEKGKLIPEFIDTGNCVARASKQIKSDVSFFTNYFVGNSDGVAKYFVNQCNYTGPNKDKVIKEIAEDIQKNIFGKKQNITKFSDVQANINEILHKHGLEMSVENATAMKAQMQFFTAIAEAGSLSGKSMDMATLMCDIPQAAKGMIKSGVNPWSSIKDAIRFAMHDKKQAVGTAYQFTIKDVDKILKSDGSLVATA